MKTAIKPAAKNPRTALVNTTSLHLFIRHLQIAIGVLPSLLSKAVYPSPPRIEDAWEAEMMAGLFALYARLKHHFDYNAVGITKSTRMSFLTRQEQEALDEACRYLDHVRAQGSHSHIVDLELLEVLWTIHGTMTQRVASLKPVKRGSLTRKSAKR